jgi:hypothetical protein
MSALVTPAFSISGITFSAAAIPCSIPMRFLRQIVSQSKLSMSPSNTGKIDD